MVDTNADPPNNALMSKPETVRRIKSYSAASGYVYQYQFQDAHPAQRDAAHGNEFVYYVSADRKTMFPIRIFVLQRSAGQVDEANRPRADRDRRIRHRENAVVSSAG